MRGREREAHRFRPEDAGRQVPRHGSNRHKVDVEDLESKIRDACIGGGFSPWEVHVEVLGDDSDGAREDSDDGGNEEQGGDLGAMVASDVPGGGAAEEETDEVEPPGILLRIISARFTGLTKEERDALVTEILRTGLRPWELIRISLQFTDTPAEAAGIVTATKVPIEPLILVQGGGAKGCWQGAVLYEILSSRTVRVEPVAVSGTSAGAINSWLVSCKLRGLEDNPFDEFWLSAPLVAWCLVPVLLLLSVVFAIRLLIEHTFPLPPQPRRTAIVPFALLEGALRLLLGETSAAIHTYMFAADVDSSQVPPVFDSQTPFRFWFQPGETRGALVNRAEPRISYARAVAASACLPSIEPVRIAGRHYADGGFYSNLPGNVAHGRKALGGTFVLCVLATPLHELKPETDCIDYRTAVLLDLLLEQQEREPVMTRCPIYVVQPAGLLKSGLWCGFLNPFLTCADLKAGHADGRTFMRAVEEAASGDEDALAKYELTRTSAPVLPAVAPRYTERWVPWVNRKWNGQQPGWRERRYPTVGTVRSGRGRRDWR